MLDNCEHLLSACATLAKTLLEGCPDLRVMATSRQALGLTGEWLYPVPPLSLPAGRPGALAETVVRSEAVRLFVARANRVKSSFAISDANAHKIGHICRRLDGLPLAIELAAAQVRVLSVDQSISGLMTASSYCGTAVRWTRRASRRWAAVDWSYDLLNLDEQELFQRACVFSGSFSLEAAEAVCAVEGIAAEQILEILYQLVEKSLLTGEDGGETVRFRLLETLRQYGLEKLRQSGREGLLRDRHLDFFLQAAEQAEPHLKGPRQADWYEHLELEHHNMRTALDWACDDPRGEKGLRLAGALWPFWNAQGHQSEGRGWFAIALDGRPRISPQVHAKALHGAGTLALVQGDYDVSPIALTAMPCLAARTAGSGGHGRCLRQPRCRRLLPTQPFSSAYLSAREPVPAPEARGRARGGRRAGVAWQHSARRGRLSGGAKVL